MSNAMRVLMLGPDLQVRGGVAAVENALIASLPPEIQVTQLPTMVEGSKWRKLGTFAAGDRADDRAAAAPTRHRPHSFREPREQRAQDAAGPAGAGVGRAPDHARARRRLSRLLGEPFRPRARGHFADVVPRRIA